jgi:hypothetical protein
MAWAGEAAPRPDTGGAEHPRCGLCLHGWAVRDPPCCRGQAVPDPPARQGRDVRRDRMSTLPCGMVAVAVAAADFAAPVARRARQRLAPTGVGCRITDRGFGRHDPVVPCRPVGVRRCLTRWPGGPAIPGWDDGHGAGWMGGVVDACHGCLPRPWRGRARQRLAPTQVGRSIPGVAYACTDGRCVIPRVVGVRRCLTERPARAGE